jgi:intracellular septation protein A
MSFGLFYTLIPVIAFAALDFYSKNIRVAVWGGVLFSFLELGVVYSASGHLDPLSIVSSILFVGLGYVSIAFSDRRFFKLQPAVAGFIAAIILAYFHLLGDSIAAQTLPALQENAPGFLKMYLEHPDFVQTLDHIFSFLIVIIILESSWIAYAALFCRQSIWVLVNAFGIWIIGFVAIVFWTIFLLFR